MEQYGAVFSTAESKIDVAIHSLNELVYHSERMVYLLMKRPRLPLLQIFFGHSVPLKWQIPRHVEHGVAF